MKSEKKAAAEKAAAKAEYLRLRAEAAKAEAGYLQDHAGADEKAVAEAWDRYQEATNEAARAQKEADEAQAEAAKECWVTGLQEAAKVKVRDYLLIEDIPADAKRINQSLTFADLIRQSLRSDAAKVAEDLARQYDLDSEPRDRIANRIDWLLDCANAEGIDPKAMLAE